MPKFLVYAVVDAGYPVGEFEAETKEEAEEMAWDSEFMRTHSFGVCHQCCRHIEIGDVTQLLVDPYPGDTET